MLHLSMVGDVSTVALSDESAVKRTIPTCGCEHHTRADANTTRRARSPAKGGGLTGKGARPYVAVARVG